MSEWDFFFANDEAGNSGSGCGGDRDPNRSGTFDWSLENAYPRDRCGLSLSPVDGVPPTAPPLASTIHSHRRRLRMDPVDDNNGAAFEGFHNDGAAFAGMQQYTSLLRTQQLSPGWGTPGSEGGATGSRDPSRSYNGGVQGEGESRRLPSWSEADGGRGRHPRTRGGRRASLRTPHQPLPPASCVLPPVPEPVAIPVRFVDLLQHPLFAMSAPS
jgi:hypothetical protein